MKALITTLLLLCVIATQAQTNLTGAYLSKKGDTNQLWLFINGYSSMISYKNDSYQSTTGGPFSYDGKTLVIKTEYNDLKPELVGQEKRYTIVNEGKDLKDANGTMWVKQAEKKQDLDALWRITGRKQGEQISTIKRGDRKTIKILVDGYFQWIAINPAEKGFYGTGGGHYGFKDNTYSEHILFFSRDNSRVGASLTFDGKIENEDWHHSGLSSKGDPIYEIWSKD